jgi:type IV pilus assembly protein PilV
VTSIKNQSGFSLMEVLVGIMVLSVGLLGIAGLQVNSLKSTRSASLRTQAMVLSQDIIESIRANKTYAIDDGANYTVAYEADLTTPATDCLTTNCNTAALAAYEMYQWRKQIYETATNTSRFPEGDAAVTIGAGNMVTVSIKWKRTEMDEQNIKENATDKTHITFTMTAML